MMLIEDVQEVGDTIASLVLEYFDTPGSREESLVRTKLEEALLWLTRVDSE